MTHTETESTWLLLPISCMLLFVCLIVIVATVAALSIIIIYSGSWKHSAHTINHYITTIILLIGILIRTLCEQNIQLRFYRLTTVISVLFFYLFIFFLMFRMTLLSHVHNRLISNWQFITPLSTHSPTASTATTPPLMRRRCANTQRNCAKMKRTLNELID